jgi:hypothetical protein
VTTTTQARKTLAELNEGFRSTGETSDFETATEYRVGKWGVAWSRDGYNGRGSGGDKLHLSVVTYITRVKEGYDWQSYCAASAYVSRGWTTEQVAKARAKQVAEHGVVPAWSHRCHQPKVGDVHRVNPVCRFENVRGTAAWTPELADTDVVNCFNCRRQFFHETVDGVEERRVERAGVEERKAAKPQPARCFWCGDVRPHTAKTKAGEQLPCSRCKEDFETIWWVETTGYSNSYFAEMADQREPAHDRNMRELGIKDENDACERLERFEGRYFR